MYKRPPPLRKNTGEGFCSPDFSEGRGASLHRLGIESIYFFKSTSPQIRFEVKFVPIHFVNKRDASPAAVTDVAPETSVAFF